MSAQELCPICGEGHVIASMQMVEYEYKGHKADLPSHYQQCDTCTSDFAGLAESKLNKRVVMAFRKQVDGLLTGDEIKAVRKQYQLTQAQAAKLLGGGPVAFSKYGNDMSTQAVSRSHDDAVVELLRADPAFANEYLAVALEEAQEPGGQAALLAALRHIAEAQGMGTVAERTHGADTSCIPHH